MNIGADKITDRGGYFAWGEPGNKDDYTQNAYLHGTSANDMTTCNFRINDGTEELMLTVQIAKSIVPEEDIYLRVNKENIPSKKVMLNNGAYIDGEDSEHYFLRVKNSRCQAPLYAIKEYID